MASTSLPKSRTAAVRMAMRSVYTIDFLQMWMGCPSNIFHQKHRLKHKTKYLEVLQDQTTSGFDRIAIFEHNKTRLFAPVGNLHVNTKPGYVEIPKDKHTPSYSTSRSGTPTKIHHYQSGNSRFQLLVMLVASATPSHWRPSREPGPWPFRDVHFANDLRQHLEVWNVTCHFVTYFTLPVNGVKRDFLIQKRNFFLSKICFRMVS